jgi:signal transduction histidine kinase
VSDRYKISDWLRNFIVLALAFLYIYICTFSIVTTRSWINRPFAGFTVLKNSMVPALWLPEWEGFKQGIKFGDIVTAVNGHPVSSGDDLNRLVSLEKIDTPVTYTIIRGRQKIELSIPVSKFTLRDYLLYFPLVMFVGFVFYAMGLVVFYLRPNLPSSWAFLFFCTMAGLSITASPEYCTNHVNAIPLVTLALTGPAALLLGLYFPVMNKARRYFIGYLLITTPVIIFLCCYFFFDTLVFHKIVIIHNIQLALTVTLGISATIHGFYTSSDPVVLQKAKVIFYGAVVSFIGGAIIIIGTTLLSKMSIFWGFIVLPVIPLSVAYAMVKHNLFDVDILIRRSTSYILVSGIVLVLFFSLIGILSLAMQKVTGQSSQIAAVISTIILVIVFRPLRSRIDKAIDRRFYREKYEYQGTIRKAGEVLSGIIELEDLVKQMLDIIINAMKIERGCIFLRPKEEELFKLVVTGYYSETPKIDFKQAHQESEILSSEHPLIMRLERGYNALQINDVEQMSIYRHDRELILEAMQDFEVILVLPIIYKHRMIGMLGLGPKANGSWYSSEDIGLLETLMVQTAVSIDNARKVDELKKMIELEASYRELVRLDELKDRFINMVSHDIRNFMTGIKGYTSLLSERLDDLDKERQARYLSIIMRESNLLAQLITDMIDLQRFEEGRMTMELEDLDLVKLVNNSLEQFMLAVREKNLTLERDMSSQEILVRGNADRLFQVVSNLLSNAIKFTPEGGWIKVGVKRINDMDMPAAVVSIMDNGPGVPLERQSTIFDKFQNVYYTKREKNQGTGLGLALVREIIEHFGGRVGLESEPGRGSNFYFIFNTIN